MGQTLEFIQKIKVKIQLQKSKLKDRKDKVIFK